MLQDRQPLERLNRAERYFEVFAEKTGWQATKKGWPDYIVHLENGEALAVEVKLKGQRLREAQHQTLCLLHRKGIPCFVYVLRSTRGAKTEGALIAFEPDDPDKVYW